MKQKLRQLFRRLVQASKPAAAGAGQVAAQGALSKAFLLVSLLILAFHCVLAGMCIFGGLWADIGVGLYLVSWPLIRVARRLALF